MLLDEVLERCREIYIPASKETIASSELEQESTAMLRGVKEL